MKSIRHLIFVLFFLVPIAGFILIHYSIFESRPLHGVTINQSKPLLSLSNWLSGKYQEQQMDYLEQNLYMRPLLVRMHNQIAYSLYNVTSVPTIVVGKDQVLYDVGFIDSYLGRNFWGENEITTKANKLSFVQQELKKRNVDLIFIIAPGKPSILPAFLPSRYDSFKKVRSNYDAFSEQLEKQQINHIDFTKYFLSLKSTSKHSLFTRCGTHWSAYGSTLAADSLFKYMENLRKIDLVDYYENEGVESEDPQYTDADLGELLNLMVDIPSYKMYYPNIVFNKDEKKIRPNVLFIGDSFLWSWLTINPYIPTLFNKHDFWYYNHHIGSSSSIAGETLISSLNLKEQALSRDFIIVETNEYGLGTPGYKFIEQMFELLQNETFIIKDSAKPSLK